MRFIIRELKKSDADKFSLFQCNYYSSSVCDDPFLWPDIRSAYNSGATNQCFIAILNGRIIGVVESERCEDYINLLNLYVLKDYRCHGIGALLVKSLKEYAQKKVYIFLKLICGQEKM